MSKTMYAEFGGQEFGAFDVSVGIFLKHVVDAAEVYAATEDWPWLRTCVENWRFNAVVSDCGIWLDPKWSDAQVQLVLRLVDAAGKTIEEHGAFTADEMASWSLMDGHGVYARGLSSVPASWALEIGNAFKGVLTGTLPAAPEGAWWHYGTGEGGELMWKPT